MMTLMGCHLQDMLKVMSLPKHWFKTSSMSYTNHDSGRGTYGINHTSDPVRWVASLRYHLWLLGVRQPKVCKDSLVLKELRSNVWSHNLTQSNAQNNNSAHNLDLLKKFRRSTTPSPHGDESGIENDVHPLKTNPILSRYLPSTSSKTTKTSGTHVRHEKNQKTLVTFHYTGWLIGILTMASYNPYIIG